MATKGATPATNKMVGRRVLESMFSEGILEEMPQSMQEQMWQNYAEDKPIFEDVDKAGVLGMFAGMAMGGGTQLLGLPSEWKRERAKVETATENADALSRIAELAAESKLRERNPDQYESLVQEQFQGSTAENIYIDGQQLANVLNQGGMTKEQLALTLPEVAGQIDQAIATGGDVIIPTAQFAARLATTDVGRALIEHARMDPDDISKAEAGIVDEKKNEMLDAAKKQQREKQMQSEEFVASAKEVESLMLEQVKQTKQYPDSVARTYAQFVRDFVVTQSASMNMQPMEYYNKYMYKVESAGAQAGDAFDQAGKLVTETPNFKNWFGNSKVVDAKSKPQVMYHGTDSSFSTFRPSFRGAFFVTPSSEFANDYTTSDLDTVDKNESNPNIMPVYVRAENPFDYENVEHVEKVIEYLHKTNLFRGIQPGWFEGGHWDKMEDRSVQKAIKALGFDSFYVNEFGTKNLGVYNPTQIKSAIGNNGEFNPENPNILRQPENAKPAIDVKEDAQADDVAGQITQNEIPEAIDQAAILENALKIANSKIWNKGR
jgi:hypothetical protein